MEFLIINKYLSLGLHNVKGHSSLCTDSLPAVNKIETYKWAKNK